MKKIKYGKRKNDHFVKQLEQLKQGDEICEAVLDTLGDDYLNYITHLVRHSKTPIKHNNLPNKEESSSDSEIFENNNQQQTLQKSKNYPVKSSQRIRHHSQTGGKTISPSIVKQQIQSKIGKKLDQDSNQKNRNKKSKLEEKRQNLPQKKSKKKTLEIDNDLKNDQKTMSFTRNTQYFQSRMRNEQQIKKWGEQKKSFNLTRPKYYTNYLQYQDENEKISINDEIIQDQKTSQRENVSNTFISEIDNYISSLQSNPRKVTQNSLNQKGKSKDNKFLVQKMKAVVGSFERSKHKQSDEEQLEYNLQYILKQNLKLNKKVKRYQQKIDQLQDQVSSHLIQCKNREKTYKNKISELVKTLSQAVSKINNQKSQITTMKSLLRSFGQKVKQIQNQSDQSDSEFTQNISEQVKRYMEPTRHQSQLRTKYKRGLQSTMPKHEQEGRWRQ